jgi:hypothetical protein
MARQVTIRQSKSGCGLRSKNNEQAAKNHEPFHGDITFRRAREEAGNAKKGSGDASPSTVVKLELLFGFLGVPAGLLFGFGSGAGWLGFAFRFLFHFFSLL